MKVLDGKAVSERIKQKLRLEAKGFYKKNNRYPHLCAILVGENPASKVYVRNKINACKKIGFESSIVKMNNTVSEEALIHKVQEINEDDQIDGVIVQLPLPKHIDETKVTIAIDPEKDVDGFHPMNIGKMFYGIDGVLPATPLGILKLIEAYNIETSGKKCVVIGRSNIVGKPISMLISQNKRWGNCTVTLCHSRTKNLKNEVKTVDIVIAAIGIPRFLKEDMVKNGAIVIDVGINRIENPEKPSGYELVGDVDYEAVSKKASYITPVPGGVGPMTVASLLINTMVAATQRARK